MSGYVKAVSSSGVFVVLARNAEARVKMGHLSDSYIKAPKEAFPEGKLVQGRVISAADGRYNLPCPTCRLCLSGCHRVNYLSDSTSAVCGITGTKFIREQAAWAVVVP